MSEETVLNTDTSVNGENASNSNEGNGDNNLSTNEGTKPNLDEIADLKAQIQNLTVNNAKLKRANDKLASENGDLNKKYREKLSDEERRSLEIAEAESLRAEKDAEKDELIKSLQREKAVGLAEKSYLAMGWTPDEANRMANAEADNDFEKRMQIMLEVNERQKKQYDVEVLKNRKPVNTGVGNADTISKEQFDKMGYKEMLAFKQSNPDLYEKYSN